MYLERVNQYLSGNTFLDCNALEGGSIYAKDCTGFIQHGTFDSGAEQGGAIFLDNSTITLTDSPFSTNCQAEEGAFVFCQNSSISADKATEKQLFDLPSNTQCDSVTICCEPLSADSFLGSLPEHLWIILTGTAVGLWLLLLVIFFIFTVLIRLKRTQSYESA